MARKSFRIVKTKEQAQQILKYKRRRIKGVTYTYSKVKTGYALYSKRK